MISFYLVSSQQKIISILSFSEVVNLKLVSLNLSSNRISMLPVELRLMDNLIELDITHNPLTVPPANVSIACNIILLTKLIRK